MALAPNLNMNDDYCVHYLVWQSFLSPSPNCVLFLAVVCRDVDALMRSSGEQLADKSVYYLLWPILSTLKIGHCYFGL